MNQWESKAFKKLQSEWYKKLKDTGFQDAEEIVGGEQKLKQNAPNVYRQADPVYIESKARYFELLTQHVASYRFSEPIDRTIMGLKSQGFKISEICSRLKQMGVPKHRQTVRFIVRRYEHNWGIRRWTPEEMNQRTK